MGNRWAWNQQREPQTRARVKQHSVQGRLGMSSPVLSPFSQGKRDEDGCAFILWLLAGSGFL